jgi:transcriptional regulator with XRE-family HTH domain
LGISQPSYALWERNDVALRAEQMASLARILGVRIEELLAEPKRAQRKPGPQSACDKRLEKFKRLPRKEQEFVLKFIDTVLEKANAKPG